MAAANKVGWAQLRVGLMALVALMILTFLIFLLTGADNPFEPKAYLYTYMSDSAALSEGTGVPSSGPVRTRSASGVAAALASGAGKSIVRPTRLLATLICGRPATNPSVAR